VTFEDKLVLRISSLLRIYAYIYLYITPYIFRVYLYNIYVPKDVCTHTINIRNIYVVEKGNLYAV